MYHQIDIDRRYVVSGRRQYDRRAMHDHEASLCGLYGVPAGRSGLLLPVALEYLTMHLARIIVPDPSTWPRQDSPY
jgi:hypothetical protein